MILLVCMMIYYICVVYEQFQVNTENNSVLTVRLIFLLDYPVAMARNGGRVVQ